MRNTVIDTITRQASLNKEIFIITGDAGFGVLDTFQERYPRRFLNLGVAEQNMIGCAAGLAMTGFKVVVYNIIPFLLYRCYEQVRNDICYQKLPVVLVGIGSGFTYAPQGITHYSVEDIVIARSLPNLIILSPADPLEAEKCAEFALNSRKPVYIRLAKSGETALHRRKPKRIDRPCVLKEGKGVAVLFHGSVGIEVMKATEDLQERPLVVSLPMIQPLDFEMLRKSLKGVHTLITVEEHFAEGGLGSLVSECVVQERLRMSVKKLGIKNEFIHAVKNVSGMRRYYGINSDSIRRSIREGFRREK